jgi:hypothetical protein
VCRAGPVGRDRRDDDREAVNALETIALETIALERDHAGTRALLSWGCAMVAL